MNFWIVPSNPDRFDVNGCINKHRFVYWRQTKYHYQVGDVIFIYISGGMGRIQYAMMVEDVEIPNTAQIIQLEKEFWATEEEPAEQVNKFRFLQMIKSDALVLQKLQENGLKGNLQGPQKIKGELLEYIMKNFDNNLFIQTNQVELKKMEAKNLRFKHRVDLSFLKYGFVISQNEVIENQKYLIDVVANNTQIEIIFKGKTYYAYFDYPSSTKKYRMMFKAPIKDVFQENFKECYIVVDGKIQTRPGVVVNVGFYTTDKEHTYIAKQVGDTITVDSAEMKLRYEQFLESLEGSFAGYVTAIDKKFVREKVKKIYDLPSAYYITNSSDVLSLVEEIRNDPISSEIDKKASSRCSSCSLKKYAEFLKSIISKSDSLPFEINVVIDTIFATGLIFDPKFVQRYLCSLLTKPFVILSGLTGSGKTQLAMAFPKLICENKSQYKLIPVGADWTNREPLLGYPNALRPGEYVMPDNGALQLILEASKPENQNKPYFLVLDEMNMSYVERYFADFLSAMESGEDIPLWEGNDKVPAAITLPKNLFIIGTINVDETTYMFSPKVLDRANVIEFRINKNQMLEYLDGTGVITQIENRAERAADFVDTASKDIVGSLSDEMKTTLISMFDTLSKIQKEFGYRTAHEMSRFITICKRYTDMSDEESIDAALVQKLLPKIHGSRKKISPVLSALWLLCYKAEAVEIDTLDAMPLLDLFKYPLTAEKIWRMYQIAQDNGFTSFAEA